MSPLDALAIFLLAAGAASVQSLTGIGFGLTIVPPLIFVIGTKEAVVVSNMLGVVLSMGLLTRIHQAVDWRMASTLFVAAIAGMPLGLWLLLAVDAKTLQVVIACTVIVFTILLARGLRLHVAGLAGDATVGLLSGVLRTSTSMSGPPVIIYMQGRQMDSTRFRSTVTAFFVMSGLVGIGLFAIGGRVDGEALTAFSAGLPAVGLGLVTGQLLYKRVDEGRFRLAVQVILVGSAIAALAGALVG
ncbi:MAG: sulfite exporter TauE/SafE family protein [Dehalococcoidia bacterium]